MAEDAKGGEGGRPVQVQEFKTFTIEDISSSHSHEETEKNYIPQCRKLLSRLNRSEL
jgi:hypothetical protein